MQTDDPKLMEVKAGHFVACIIYKQLLKIQPKIKEENNYEKNPSNASSNNNVVGNFSWL